MNKNQFFSILYVVLIISVIIFMIYVVTLLRTHSKECLKDPISYFESLNEGYECYCVSNGKIIPFGQDSQQIENYINPY